MDKHKEIKQRREELGMTIKEMSDAIGLDKKGDTYLRRCESGKEVIDEELYTKIMKKYTWGGVLKKQWLKTEFTVFGNCNK